MSGLPAPTALKSGGGGGGGGGGENRFSPFLALLGAHDDDVAMQLLADCEQRILPLLVRKRIQSKISDFFKFWK